VEFCKGLAKNRSITTLNLGFNRIGPKGAAAVGDTLLRYATQETDKVLC
jgi:hypothetical protein